MRTRRADADGYGARSTQRRRSDSIISDPIGLERMQLTNHLHAGFEDLSGMNWFSDWGICSWWMGKAGINSDILEEIPNFSGAALHVF
ncbi:hypothetical protein OPV22_017049 [Ensete ventricosum]|uniref:Uncharacterized protein n=1 Tax=Ensete ventricosum TaxID=4639 RepID=A0AAV8QWX2_ENSVE|nr:hypothetical protein OPV22_017049 [Ensete ventricosum]